MHSPRSKCQWKQKDLLQSWTYIDLSCTLTSESNTSATLVCLLLQKKTRACVHACREREREVIEKRYTNPVKTSLKKRNKESLWKRKPLLTSLACFLSESRFLLEGGNNKVGICAMLLSSISWNKSFGCQAENLLRAKAGLTHGAEGVSRSLSLSPSLPVSKRAFLFPQQRHSDAGIWKGKTSKAEQRRF